jgi:peptidoglycan/LPS O-acetylase OafA/YrhL
LPDVLSQDARRRTFHTLDGMRGVAAVGVLLLHLPVTSQWPIPGAHLAVDLFFALSGFVLAYANEDRLRAGMGWARFMGQRYLRLYPLYILGTIAVAVLTLLPGQGQDHPARVGVQLGFALLFLPVPPGLTDGPLFPLNFPAWSLFYELVANLLFAQSVKHITPRRLAVFVAVAGLALVVEGVHRHTLDLGWNYITKVGGIVRVLFSFAAGIGVYQLWKRGWRTPRLPAVLVALAPAPLFLIPGDRAAVELAEALLVFPLLILAGASTEPTCRWRPLLTLSGEISYPLYVLQAAMMLAAARIAPYQFSSDPFSTDPFGLSGGRYTGVLVAMFIPASLLVSWLAYRLYDVPVRRALRRLESRRAMVQKASPV